MSNGLFSGELVSTEQGSCEHVGAAEREALLAVALALLPESIEAPPEGASIVRSRFDPERGVLYDRDLSAGGPWGRTQSWPRRVVFALLARVARTLAAMHEKGVVHGDVRPETLWVGPDETVSLVVHAGTPQAGSLLRARLRSLGASPEVIAYAAPECVAQFGVSAASDVFSLSAIVFATVAGYAPLGQVSLEGVSPALAELARCLGQGLSQVPAARPPMAQLAAALDRASVASHLNEETGIQLSATPPGTAGQAPGALPLGPPGASSGLSVSPWLATVMVIGGAIVALGAVQLVLKSWDVFGSAGHVGLLAVLSVLSAITSVLCDRKKIAMGVWVGRSLSVFFASVAMSYAFYLLEDWGKLYLSASLAPLAWVASVLCRRKGFAAVATIGEVTAAGFAMVASGYGLYLFSDVGRLVLWLVLSISLLVAGMVKARDASSRSPDVLLSSGTQMLWGAGVQALILTQATPVAGPLAAISATVTAITYALALKRGSGALGVLAAMDFAFFSAAFGAHIRTGTVMGPAMYSLAVAAGYALLATVAAAVRAGAVSRSFAVGAVLSALLSALSSGVAMIDHWDTHGIVAAAWPYGIVAIALGIAAVSTQARSAALWTAWVLLALVPSVHAMVRSEPQFAALAATVGMAVLVSSWAVPSWREPRGPRLVWTLAGLLSILSATDLRLLYSILRTGADIEPLAAALWGVMGVGAAAMLALSYASKAWGDWPQRQMLETLAIVRPIGLLLALSMASSRSIGTSVLSIGLCAACAVLGLATKRAYVFGAALIGVILNMALTDLRLLAAILRSAGAEFGELDLGLWSLMSVGAVAMLVLSYAGASRLDRAQRRAIELGAIAQPLGLLSLQCLVDSTRVGFVALSLLSSVALVVLGLVSRRRVVLGGGAIAAIVNAWIQYFQRLDGVVPRSVLMIGFGVGLLILGVLYDQFVRPRLAAMKDWG